MEHCQLLARNIRREPVEIVKIFAEAKLTYTKKAIVRKRRRIMNNYVSLLDQPEKKGAIITPIDHVVNLHEDIHGVTLNGRQLTITNKGLSETKHGFEIAEVIKPGDKLEFN